jgi:hypothetical protein
LLSLKAGKENLDWILDHDMWYKISHLHDPNLIKKLSPYLFDLASKDNRCFLVEGKNSFSLLSILLYMAHNLGIAKDILLNLPSKISKFRKNPQAVQTLLHTLYSLLNTPILTSSEIEKGFRKIFSANDSSTILKYLVAAKGLIQLKNTVWVTSSENPSEAFRSLFKTIIPLEDFQGDISESFDTLFACSRYPFGLITYAAGLKTLNEPEVITCLASYVKNVFEGTFKDSRYELSNNIHLTRLHQVRPDLLNLWKKDVEMGIEEFSTDKAHAKKDFREWIKLKLIADKHLGEVPLPLLQAYYEESKREEVLSQLNQELLQATQQDKNHELREKIKTDKTFKNELRILKEKVNKDAYVAILKLQQACIALAEANPKDFIKRLEEIEKILVHPTVPKTGFDTSEFLYEVRDMIQNLKNPSKTPIDNNYRLVFHDDPLDLLYCGTDIIGSCQRIEGEPENNKGLLVYMVDGKNRLLAIKDSSGRIVSRTILRLLWDGEQPVLYRERLYPGFLIPGHKEILNRFTVDLGVKLGLPVVCGDEGESYGKHLQSFEGPAPYEYCDGAGGVKYKGRYTITKVFKMS